MPAYPVCRHSRRPAAALPGRAILVAVLVLMAAGLAASPATALRRDRHVAALVVAFRAHHGDLRRSLNQLAGVSPATVGGSSVTFRTRSATNASATALTEQYVYERLSEDGLSVSYQSFRGSPAGRNVVGEIGGGSRAGEVVLLTAHLDDRPWAGRAPGADDDGSGCAALLAIARRLAGHSFARTVRFVFFGAEESGLVGSRAYAAGLRAAGADVVVDLNADMIGWNPSGSHVVAMVTRSATGPGQAGEGDLWAARQLQAAARTYGFTRIRPRVYENNAGWSDHRSFWVNGYPGLTVIEDESSGENPHYHSAGDSVGTISWPYYARVTNVLQATVAHLAYMDGMLTSSSVHVAGITLSGVRSGGRYGVRAEVVVCDASGTAVEDADVRVAFAGPASGTAEALTGAAGGATLLSPLSTRGGSWTVTVTGVSSPGWSYAAGQDARASARLTWPRR